MGLDRSAGTDRDLQDATSKPESRGQGDDMTKDEKQHLNKLSAIGCVLCHLQGTPGSPSEIHHPRKGTGMGQRASHYDAIPLCPAHHRGDIGIHGMGVKAFTKHYQVDEAELLHVTRRLVAHNDHLSVGWRKATQVD